MKVQDKDIISLISQHQVKDQSELVALLADNGMSITQASLSRRLKKLGVQKIDGYYQATDQQSAKRLSDTVLQVDVAPPNLVIIRTLSGSAHYAADYLDEIIESGEQLDPTGQYQGMIATIAGDDTIMVVINDPTRINAIADLIRSQSL